ncbi:Rab6 [Entamoeba marina]
MSNLLISIALCGDPYVGKTCFFQRFQSGEFNSSTTASVGCDVTCKKLTLDGKEYNIQLWDTAGQEVFRSTTTTYFRNRHCILFTYDITKRETLEHVEDWIGEFHQVQPDSSKTLTALIGCKSDLEEQRQITLEEGEEFAQTHDFPFFELRELRLKNMLQDINPLTDEQKKDDNPILAIDKSIDESSNEASTAQTCC